MNRICVALDAPDPEKNLELARAVAEHVGYVKIGLTSFTTGGPDLAAEISTIAPLFVDLKLHDIPAQVGSAITNISSLGASLTTVHASGGSDMIKAAVAAASDHLKVVAVTVLTSLDDPSLEPIGLRGPVEDAVLRLAEMALGAGADGLVCSPLEVTAIRDRFGADPFVVVPGIRSVGSGRDDQKRTLGPGAAVAAGASLLVVGRPITEAPDPAAAARALAIELASDPAPVPEALESEGGSGGIAKLASDPPENKGGSGGEASLRAAPPRINR